jgi:acid-sensing ion channel, other
MSFFRRNCYFEYERKLKYFNKYTKHNCLQECLTNSTVEMCSCVPSFYVRKELRSQFGVLGYYILFHFIGGDKTDLCQEIDYNCFINVLWMVYDESSESFKRCNCLPSCNSIDYNIEVQKTLHGTHPAEAENFLNP